MIRKHLLYYNNSTIVKAIYNVTSTAYYIKNDLPSNISNNYCKKNNIIPYISPNYIEWRSDQWDIYNIYTRCNDLPAFIYCSNFNQQSNNQSPELMELRHDTECRYYKYLKYYRYNGYAKFSIYRKSYNFFMGVCIKLLKEELLNV